MHTIVKINERANSNRPGNGRLGEDPHFHRYKKNAGYKHIEVYYKNVTMLQSGIYRLKSGNAVIVVPALGVCISPMKTDYAPIGELGNSPTSVNAPRTEDKKTRMPSEHNE